MDVFPLRKRTREDGWLRANQGRYTQWTWHHQLTAPLALLEIHYNQPVPEKSVDSCADTCTSATHCATISKMDTCANMCTVFMHYMLMHKPVLFPPERAAAHNHKKMMMNQMWTQSHMLSHAFLFHKVGNTV